MDSILVSSSGILNLAVERVLKTAHQCRINKASVLNILAGLVMGLNKWQIIYVDSSRQLFATLRYNCFLQLYIVIC